MNRTERRAMERAQRRSTNTHGRKRRTGYADTLGGMRVLSESMPFSAAEVADLTLPPAMAYQAISTGQSCPGDWDTLAAVVNVSLIRAERIALVGYGRPGTPPDELAEQQAAGRQAVALCKEAQEALMHMRERFRRLGRWGVDAQARESIPAVIDFHEQLLQLSTPGQMRAALLEVLHRCHTGQVHRIEPTTA